MSSLEALKWVYWIVGTVGIAGTIALWVFFPVVARGIASFAFSMLHELLATRFGCALLGVVVSGLAVNYMRASIDAQDFAQRTAQFEQLQKERDAKIAEDTRASVLKEVEDAKKLALETDKAVKDYTDGLPIGPPAPAPNPYRVGDDACKLRFIAGLPPCGSQRAQRVRKARSAAAAAINHARQRLPFADGAIPGPTEKSQ